MYAEKYETALFSEEEFFDILDSLLLAGTEWVSRFKLYKKEHPNSAKNKNELKWSKKFYQACLDLKKEMRSDIITMEMIDKAFSNIMGKKTEDEESQISLSQE